MDDSYGKGHSLGGLSQEEALWSLPFHESWHLWGCELAGVSNLLHQSNWTVKDPSLQMHHWKCTAGRVGYGAEYLGGGAYQCLMGTLCQPKIPMGLQHVCPMWERTQIKQRSYSSYDKEKKKNTLSKEASLSEETTLDRQCLHWRWCYLASEVPTKEVIIK